jgi:hypothetical protein
MLRANLCEFLWRMHYSFTQDMVDTMKTWPEYKKLLEILREKGVDVDRITEILRTFFGLSWRGNVFNGWKCNGISMCFVLTYIKCHDME